MAKSVFLLPLLLWGCGERVPPLGQDGAVQQDSGVKADTAADQGLADGPAPLDGSPVQLDGGPLAFCSGPAKAFVADKPLKITGYQTGLGVMASCCRPGEFVTVKTKDGAGKSVDLRLEILRLPGTPLPTAVTIDLAKPPKGWMIDVRCEPVQYCGFLRADNATFKGTLKMTALLGAPAYEISACLDARPLSPPGPYAKPVKLYFNKIMVNTACTQGMDHTCNADPLISTLRGTCSPDSTCTCNPGAKKTPNGKCL